MGKVLACVQYRRPKKECMKFRQLLLTWCIILSCISTVRAKDLYVAQNTAGADSGVDSANAHALAWLNASANWPTGSNSVNPGDVIHLVGTLTNTLTIGGGGTVGNPIKVYFEPGAKFSVPALGYGGEIGRAH